MKAAQGRLERFREAASGGGDPSKPRHVLRQIEHTEAAAEWAASVGLLGKTTAEEAAAHALRRSLQKNHGNRPPSVRVAPLAVIREPKGHRVHLPGELDHRTRATDLDEAKSTVEAAVTARMRAETGLGRDADAGIEFDNDPFDAAYQRAEKKAAEDAIFEREQAEREAERVASIERDRAAAAEAARAATAERVHQAAFERQAQQAAQIAASMSKRRLRPVVSVLELQERIAAAEAEHARRVDARQPSPDGGRARVTVTPDAVGHDSVGRPTITVGGVVFTAASMDADGTPSESAFQFVGERLTETIEKEDGLEGVTFDIAH